MSLQSNHSTGTPPAAAALRGMADWLRLAAAPTFAVMAFVAGVPAGGHHAMSGSHGASPLSGMVLMYLLMSVFHLAPWLTFGQGPR